MHPRLRELRAACLPFVTRALRGSTRRRVMLGSGLLLVAVLLLGAWIGRSPGYAAHDMRVSLGLEQNRWEREHRELIIFADDEQELRELLADDHRFGPVRSRAEDAWLLLDAVAGPHVIPPRDLQGLQQRARALRDARLDLAPPDAEDQRRYQHFDWYSARDRQRLQAVLDAELQPRIMVYASPLDAAATMRIVGTLAGGLLLLLWLVLGPLWVGVQLAQELHENTLQPLTGTALTARQLVVGLAAGPLAPIAIVAAPLLVVTLLAALVAGRFVPVLGVVGMGLAMGAMLVGLCMLLALAVGRHRAPGIVGIGLCALLGAAALAGTAAGLNLEHETLGLVTILPGAGPMHLLSEAFLPQAHLSSAQAWALDLRLGLAALGAVVLAALIVRALERRVGGTHHDGALRPMEAGVAALVIGVLAVAALPGRLSFGEAFLAGTAIALLPLQLVLVGRVPGGDVPPALRQVPVVPLLREHAAWLAVLLVVALVAAGAPEELRPGAIFGVAHLGWALVVAAMVTLRGTALPTSILAKLWLMVCLGFVAIEYVTAAMWFFDEPRGELLFPLAAAHPILGLLHVGMFVWIPIALVRALTPADRPALDLHARDDA